MQEKYKQVNCNFYDQLERYATLKTKLFITYAQNNSEIREEIEIKTLETQDKSEYLISNLDKRIRLDQIISILEA